MENLVDGIMIAAQEFADARVMAARGVASEEGVYSAFVALRGVAESVQVEIDRITECGRAHIRRAAEFEAQRDDARQRAESIRATLSVDLEYEIRRTRSLETTVADLIDRINELKRENAHAIAENQRLAGQLRKLRPLIAYGGTY